MRKRLAIIALLLTAAMAHDAKAQTITPMRGVVADAYNFWLYQPGNDTTAAEEKTSKPLVVFLHGKSLSGTDLNRVRRYGTIKAIEMGLELDAFVIAPQTNHGWQPEKVWKLVEWMEDNYAVDTNRIYVLGMSMGGYGTINTAAAYHDKIAAAMALCGGGTAKSYCGMCEMPMWIMHGTADRAVPISASDKVVKAMADCGDTSRLRYTRLAGQNHGVLARLFYLDETYEWLLAHNLQDEGRPVDRTVSITVADLPNAYNHLAGKKSKAKIEGGSHATAKSSGTGSSSGSTGARYYTIKKGDTLGKIAQRNGTSVKKLCKLNNMSETTTLRIGRKIRIR